VTEELQLNDPQTLYRRWEDSQWSPFTIDLGTDQQQWPQLGEHDLGLIHYVLASLMVAEERITTKFSGLVGAHTSEEEATFLATQQVDEARHMQFYARFQDEVMAAPDTIAAHVALAREQVSDAFRTSSTSPSSKPMTNCWRLRMTSPPRFGSSRSITRSSKALSA
jgi:ribonucleotide reductase beta subunit family protein with ferritin-like domain